MRNDVWIRANGTTGGLTVGYGSGSTQIGPELGFGHRIGGLNEDRVLIVKVAKGGRDLATISCHRVPDLCDPGQGRGHGILVCRDPPGGE